MSGVCVCGVCGVCVYVVCGGGVVYMVCMYDVSLYKMYLCWEVLLGCLLSLSQIYCFNLFGLFIHRSCISSVLLQFEPACRE
jgi:hypothetical protein